jgi:hypothetical protein
VIYIDDVSPAHTRTASRGEETNARDSSPAEESKVNTSEASKAKSMFAKAIKEVNK